MAQELGDTAGVREWSTKFDRTAELINRYMWDPQDKFYYNVRMTDNSFVFEGTSLKRKELIGFLPMWAHVAHERTGAGTREASHEPEILLAAVRRADACRERSALHAVRRRLLPLERTGLAAVGLHRHARTEELRVHMTLPELVGQKMMDAVSMQLSINHRFWESYSPDYPVQESPSNYIWDAIMAKVLLDMYGR